ncbi:MAG: alpha amylase C-terminal domain-containing protein, partial [Planctomycetaceae bacterium]|nr:alpha amylase C-terminal domain-containing protein [Planctomycetaceae bacterium]
SLVAQMPGDYWQQFANLRLLYGYQYCMPGKKLMFMGCELAQWHEWNHDSELDWALIGNTHHDGVRNFIGDLNQALRAYPALHEVDFSSEGFSWIHADDADNSTYAFCRISKDQTETLVCIFNFTPVSRDNYLVGVPHPGFYKEVVNSDAATYGGTNVGNAGGVTTIAESMHGRDQSIEVVLPPLGMMILRYEGETKPE